MNYDDDTIQITIEKSIKWLRRYDTFNCDHDALLQILWLALKGVNCKTDHLDVAQKQSVVEFLTARESEITDPYVKQFLKEHR